MTQPRPRRQEVAILQSQIGAMRGIRASRHGQPNPTLSKQGGVSAPKPKASAKKARASSASSKGESASPAPGGPIVLALDMMGSDKGVRQLVRGISRAHKRDGDMRFLLFGREGEIKKALGRNKTLAKICEIRHCEDVVSMEDKPSQVMRHGKATSMFAAIQAVKNGEANVAVSCGNTGALMALSMLILRKAVNISRPAIAVFWPTPDGDRYNIMLDGGADIRADAHDLFHFAVMGASYARNVRGLKRPSVGILNVGTEAGKGSAEIQEAAKMIKAAEKEIGIRFVGFVEGSALVGNTADVIVTDGFTGNVALKTAESVARLMSNNMRKAFRHTPLSRIGAMFAYTSLRRLSKRHDPRHSNGGVFLGLGGTVIKSHGSSDSIAFAAAIRLAFTLARQDFHKRMTARLSGAIKKSQAKLAR